MQKRPHVVEIPLKSGGSSWAADFGKVEGARLRLRFNSRAKAKHCTLARALTIRRRAKEKLPREERKPHCLPKRDVIAQWEAWLAAIEVSKPEPPGCLQGLAGVRQLSEYQLSGIYFLSNEDGQIIYVGMTTSAGSRVCQHKRKVRFHQAWFVPCPVEWLRDLEAHFIAKFDPVLNHQRWGPAA